MRQKWDSRNKEIEEGGRKKENKESREKKENKIRECKEVKNKERI